MGRNVDYRYADSPLHAAVIRSDHAALRGLLAGLPRISEEVVSRADSEQAELASQVVSLALDRRDGIPRRETPLQLAIRLGDAASVSMLLEAGADSSLQNAYGWNALQEALFAGRKDLACAIAARSPLQAWAKWRRRLPRVTAAMRRSRDFYLEITFHFESTIVPFLDRVAPSDTYRIWKRGANLRADMTLAGFDGFQVKRADQTFLFLGDGSDDGTHSPGTLLLLNHKEKEVIDALAGAGTPPPRAKIAKDIDQIAASNIYRPGIDVTQATLAPLLNWRRQERTEKVGPWKCKLFEMQNVTVSLKSHRVLSSSPSSSETSSSSLPQLDSAESRWEEITSLTVMAEPDNTFADDVSFEEEVNQHSETPQNAQDQTFCTGNHLPSPPTRERTNLTSKPTAEFVKKGWFRWRKKDSRHSSSNHKNRLPESESSQEIRVAENHITSPVNRKRVTQNTENDHKQHSGDSEVELTMPNHSTMASHIKKQETQKSNLGKETEVIEKQANGEVQGIETAKIAADLGEDNAENNLEREIKKGLKPKLWLTNEFPLKTEELLPLLDVLADKVKAVRRLREVLTTTLPSGMFPVKISIPLVATIEVLITFSKFEELQPSEIFYTPPSSPSQFQEFYGNEVNVFPASKSWYSWLMGSQEHSIIFPNNDEIDPFSIPHDYKLAGLKKTQPGKGQN